MRMLIKSAVLHTILILGIVEPIQGACNQEVCVAGCGSFDARLNSCQYDYQQYNNIETCVCAGIGSVSDNEQSLINCLSCNNPRYGINTIQTYQAWAGVCALYETHGETAAVRLGSRGDEAAIQYYSKNVLAVVQSVCGMSASSAARITVFAGTNILPVTMGLALLLALLVTV